MSAIITNVGDAKLIHLCVATTAEPGQFACRAAVLNRAGWTVVFTLSIPENWPLGIVIVDTQPGMAAYWMHNSKASMALVCHSGLTPAERNDIDIASRLDKLRKLAGLE